MLPAPNLDDREFQDLLDDARRLVRRRCPNWGGQRESDPGDALIEVFARMVEQLIHRLNRVPGLNYLKFLDLVGLELRPPAAARGAVTFWLSAPLPHTVVVRAETEVATPRTDIVDPVVFSTLRDLPIVPCSFILAQSAVLGGGAVDHTSDLLGSGFDCFSATPGPGDVLLVGLSNPVPSCTVVVRMDCRVSGIGIRPDWPPLIWEAWTGTGWAPCDLDRDETGGMNRPGDVVLHVPDSHQASILVPDHPEKGRSYWAGWLRCRVVAADEDQPMYTESPRIGSLTAFTIGGTVGILHGRVIRNEDIGVSDGTSAQRFRVQQCPMLPWDEPTVVQVVDDSGVTEWSPVEHFAESGPDDNVFHLDPVAGDVRFGPAIGEADGSVRRYGAVPPRGARLGLPAYRSGGGLIGTVDTGRIRVLKTSVPYISRVENRAPTVGGVDGQDLHDAEHHGPRLLHSRGRAVTAEDFIELTRQVAPEIARVHCLPDAPWGVRVMLVPHVVGDAVGQIRWDDLLPLPETVSKVQAYLNDRCLVGIRVTVGPPDYQPLTVTVSVRARRGYHPDRVRDTALRAVFGLFDPLRGGPENTGWPYGRTVAAHEVSAALVNVPGVDTDAEIAVELSTGPGTHGRQQPLHRLRLAPSALLYSNAHQVDVRR